MAVKTRQQIFSQSKVFAVLDQDAFENMDQKPKFREIYEAHSNIIKSLTFTPEVWLIEKLNSASQNLKQTIRNRFHAELPLILQSENYRACNSTKIAAALAALLFNS